MAKMTQAKIDANARYNRKTYERIPFDVRRDAELSGEAIRAHAAAMGESLNSFLKRAVTEAIERDKLRLAEADRGSSD